MKELKPMVNDKIELNLRQGSKAIELYRIFAKSGLREKQKKRFLFTYKKKNEILFLK